MAGLLDDTFGNFDGNGGLLSFYNRLLNEIQPNAQSTFLGPSAITAATGPARGQGSLASVGRSAIPSYPRIDYTNPAELGSGGGSAPVQPAPQPAANMAAAQYPSLQGLGNIGDRLGAGLFGALNSGSPMGALGALLGGLVTGRRQDPLGMAERQQQDIYSYLVQAGTPPQQAAIIAQSPKAQELYIGQMIQPKVKFGQVGEGPLGDKQFGFINETTGKVTPYNAGASGGGSAIPMGPDGQPMQGQALLDYYKKAQPEAASMIEAIIRGDAGVTGRNLQKYMPIATLVDPTLSQFNYDTRKKTALEFAAGGKSANNVKSLETVGGHIDKMMGAFEGLDNSNYPAVNGIKNWLAVQKGAGAVNAYETAANGVANELGSVFRSYGMSDAEVKSWRDRIGSSNSPEQFQASMGMLLDMLKTRKEALQEQYQQGLGKLMPDSAFQKLDSAIEKIQKRLSPTLPTQQAQAAPAIPTQPSAVPPGSMYSPSRNQWRDRNGKIYDASGKPI